MGQGIGGAIQLTFTMNKFDFERDDRKYFSTNYFDFYEREDKGSEYLFTIKPNLFMPNYGGMLREFYEAIGESMEEKTGIAPDCELLKISNFDEFKVAFSSRNGLMPLIWDYELVSIIACKTYAAWVFYDGSYKAYLEDYSTLTHFERVLGKLMKNPLASIIKFGECG